MSKTKIILIALAALLLVVLTGCGPKSVYPDAVRLHVVANSDNAEDQAVKLKVRDEIVASCGDVIASVGNAEDCFLMVDDYKDTIVNIANDTLEENGFDYDADAFVGWYQFPTRMYDEATLPGGEYRTLRVELGDAAGKNWWCVLYPPMCISVKDKDLTELEDVDLEGDSEDDIVMRSFIFEKLFGRETPQPGEEAKSRLLKWLKQMGR